MKRTLVVRLLAVVFVLATAPSFPGEARAQADFATCAPDLPACTGALNDCCYRSFDAVGSDRAIVIPMDRCHQRISAAGIEGPPLTTSPAWCNDPSAVDDAGMLEAYGLVYRLMQRGIPVYWVVNPTKDPPHLTRLEPAGGQSYTERDIDVWILAAGGSAPVLVGDPVTSCAAGCTDPVRRIDPATFTPIDDSYNYREFPLRGGAFVIAPADRPRFADLYMRQGEFIALAGDADYDFSAVDLYEVDVGATFAYQDYRTAKPAYALGNGGNAAPIALRIDYAPPRLARLAPGGPSQVWLAAARLDSAATYPGCKTPGPFSPVDAVYCDLSDADIQAGDLVGGDFDWAWLDAWADPTPCGSPAEIAQVTGVTDFMTAVAGTRDGGSVMFMNSVIDVFEGCPAREPAGRSGIGLTSIAVAPSEPLILRRPHSLFMQWGDLPTDLAPGTAGKWRYAGGGANGYDPSHTAATGSLVRLVTEDRAGAGNGICTDHVSAGGCDVFAISADADFVDSAAYLRFGDEPDNGVAFYQGGNDVTGRNSHLRLALNSMLAMPAGLVSQTPESREVSRSSPLITVVAGVESQYQGTFELLDPVPPVSTYDGPSDDLTFEFPYFKGHLRATEVTDIPTTPTDFEDLPFRFDAGADGKIPPVTVTGCATNFTSACRTVFTTVEQPDVVADDGLVVLPAPVFLDTDNVAALKPLMAPALSDAAVVTLISRVLAGVSDGSGGWVSRLGGIDRSTMAIVGQSPLIPAAPGFERPTVIYAGATDGMIHAICAEIRGACTAEGQELWAFIPRSQLPALRSNSSRLDGSPKVADVFDDFDPTDALVQRDWRTILTIQTGSGSASVAGAQPAVVALDVSDPTAPVVLWERTTRATRTAVEQGIGHGLAMGPARLGGTVKNLTFLHTNNGGTGSAGFYFAAIDTATGAILWERRHQYPAPRDGANPPVPASGIPGGPVAFDRENSSFITHVVAPSLYGDLWMWEADGDNPFGTVPVFRFSTDFHPIGATPAVYADQSAGRLHALIVSGGYTDPISATWSPDTAGQFVVSVALDASPANAPIDEVGGGFGEDRAFVLALDPGVRAFAQAVVAGNEFFVTTDSADVNELGYGSASSGLLSRYSLDAADGGSATGTMAIAGGASSVDVTAAGIVHAGSGAGAVKADIATIGGTPYDAVGRSVELDDGDSAERLLWISG